MPATVRRGQVRLDGRGNTRKQRLADWQRPSLCKQTKNATSAGPMKTIGQKTGQLKRMRVPAMETSASPTRRDESCEGPISWASLLGKEATRPCKTRLCG